MDQRILTAAAALAAAALLPAGCSLKAGDFELTAGASRVVVSRTYDATGVVGAEIESVGVWPIDAKTGLQHRIADEGAEDAVAFDTEHEINVAAQASAGDALLQAIVLGLLAKEGLLTTGALEAVR